MGFDVKPRLGLVEMVWVTAKQSNNKARGRAAHPGATHSITASITEGLKHFAPHFSTDGLRYFRPYCPDCKVSAVQCLLQFSA